MRRTGSWVLGAAVALVACSDARAITTATSTGSPTPTPAASPPVTRPPRPAGIPDVDLTRHEVALEAIVFDTFDGGFVSLADSTPELRSRLRDVIPPLDDPHYEPAAANDWLATHDLVVGYVAGGAAHAYPIRILNSHEIVNDVLGGVPVLVSYCPLCRSAVVYDRRTVAGELTFSNTSALHESDLVMVDRETGSYWWQVAGSAVVGELTGARLDPLPSELATWSDWRDRHPDTLVMSRDTGFQRRYERDNFSRYEEAVAAGDFAFPVSDAATDDRLGAADIVVAVEVAGRMLAYEVDALHAPIDDEVGDLTVRVTPHAIGAAAELVADDGGTTPLGTRTAFWFSIVSSFPDVDVRTR